MEVVLSDRDFNAIRKLVDQELGIDLPACKKALVFNRLSKRLYARQMNSFSDYYALITSGHDDAELQCALDAITTNETYFWREQKHFEFLSETILAEHSPLVPFRVWSAACSSGEEPYSIAMALAESACHDWEVIASDVSSQVLLQAERGIYPLERVKQLPQLLLHRYCLKGEGPQQGHIRVEKHLRQKIQLKHVNLKQPLPELGFFHLIFLRNVLIYFDQDMKRDVVQRVSQKLLPGGYLFVGHAESLHNIELNLRTVKPAIYRKPR
jgi:chemotaxis protein methyltransferase CheR